MCRIINKEQIFALIIGRWSKYWTQKKPQQRASGWKAFNTFPLLHIFPPRAWNDFLRMIYNYLVPPLISAQAGTTLWTQPRFKKISLLIINPHNGQGRDWGRTGETEARAGRMQFVLWWWRKSRINLRKKQSGGQRGQGSEFEVNLRVNLRL